MRFGNPRILWLFWILMPLLGWFLWWAWRKKQSLIAQFVQSRLLANLTVGVSKTVQKTRMALLTLAVGLLIVTIAQPQWGFGMEEARQRGLDIAVAIDTSRSMLAADIAPNRLERAKLAALDLMRLAKNDRLGLVAFAGTAFLQCPLTLDEEAFRQSVSALDVGIIPQGGTALSEAIDAALKAFKDEEENHKVIVLFTDGEDHEEGSLEAAKRAAKRGVLIFTVGIGTPNGELLRQRDETGALNYIKDDQGNVVKSRLNEALLTQIATTANGFYLPMSGATTVDVLYERGLAPLPKKEISSKMIQRFKERYQWPLALAILFLVMEMFLLDRKRIQKNEVMAAAATNAGLRKAVLLLLLGAWTVNTSASPASALRNYEAGKFKEAAQEYEKLLERNPNDPKLHYNAGAAAYQAGDFEQAGRHFAAALASPDLDLQQRTYYNQGNSLFRSGEQQTEAPKKTDAWEQAVKQYESALKLNPQDRDSQFNLEFVKKELEKLKQQQQQQQDQPSKDQSQDKKEEDKQDQKEQDKQDQKQQPDPSKESQSKKDQPKQQDQKEKEQKQGKEKSDEQKKQEQTKDSQKKEDKDGSKSKDKAASKSGDKPDKEPGEAGQTATALGQMTQEQVKQLLDAQKSEEKAMIFAPPEKAKGKARIYKDW
jgi:Ca-activated chloride channel family protein